MSVYNAESFLGKCIESVQNQKHRAWELVLIDDSSTDRSFDLCLSYAEEDSRIKVIKNYNNQCVRYTRNKGIESATGENDTF